MELLLGSFEFRVYRVNVTDAKILQGFSSRINRRFSRRVAAKPQRMKFRTL
jgi:hypothetical protein